MNGHNDEHSYKEFLDSPPVVPSETVTSSVLEKIRADMSFSPLAVIAKLGIMHTLGLLLILYICPQLGVRIGDSSFTLMETYMKFGHLACAALCGVTLIGGTFFVTALLLKPQESFWLKKQMPWVPISLSVLTLIALVLMGASGHHLEFLIWCAFGILGGWATFEMGRMGRIYVSRFALSA